MKAVKYMIKAFGLQAIESEVSQRYDFDEQRIVGIMLARYSISVSKNIIDECYHYWDVNSGKTLDVFWCGYGKYLYPTSEDKKRIPLAPPIDDDGAYFDIAEFVAAKRTLNQRLKRRYNDHVHLILLNYRNGKLHYDEAFQIDLEENIDENNTKIRDLMEWIVDECETTHCVQELVKHLKVEQFFNTLRGIKVSELIEHALSAASTIQGFKAP